MAVDRIKYDLLTCPFCGSDEQHVYHGHGGDKVQCLGCGVSGILVKIWNQRAKRGGPE